MTAPRETGELLFLGDSLIEYFDWAERFPHRRVRNLGVSGEPVEGLLERIDVVTSEYPEAAAFIMTGINDIAMDQSGFIGEYRKIILKLREAYPAGLRIHIHTLLPTLLHWIDPAEIRRVNSLIAKLSEETGVRLIDMHDLFLERGLHDLLAADGIHLSGRGYELWASVLEPVIAEL